MSKTMYWNQCVKARLYFSDEPYLAWLTAAAIEKAKLPNQGFIFGISIQSSWCSLGQFRFYILGQHNKYLWLMCKQLMQQFHP